MTPDPGVSSIRDVLRGRVTAAALTPFEKDGSVARDAVPPYAAALREGGVGALAVGAHTGRGAYLDPAELAWLVRAFGEASGLPVVAGLSVHTTRGGHAPDDLERLLVTTALQLRAAGADALLVSPVAGASRADTVRLHERLGREVGLPLLAFVLYERASGCQYDAGTVTELLGLPLVCGVKVALLDDAMGCQDLLVAARQADPEALLLTGEDRMYGPSLMWGAEAALVGIAAALPSWSTEVLDTWTRGDHTGFVASSLRLDALACATFRAPMEGYVQRMAWVAAWQGVIPAAVARDPFGPSLPRDEHDHLVRTLDELSRLPAGAGPDGQISTTTGMIMGRRR
jgi:4-hydroxy-tetrahydrodipicolinate synthase